MAIKTVKLKLPAGRACTAEAAKLARYGVKLDDFITEFNVKTYGVGWRVLKTKVKVDTSTGTYHMLLPDAVGAYNSKKPKLYKVAVLGRSGLSPIPDDEAKAYYLKCLGQVFGGFPLRIMAYAVLSSRVLLVVASYDQTSESLHNALRLVNTMYDKYFTEKYGPVGNLFRYRLPMQIIAPEHAAEAIDRVHSAPTQYGLGKAYRYRFSSFMPNEISTLEPLSELLGREKAEKAVSDAHAGGPHFYPTEFLVGIKADRIEGLRDECLAKQHIYCAYKLSRVQMSRLLADMNELGGFTFREMAEHFHIRQKDYFSTLALTVGEMAVRKIAPFTSYLNRLGAPYDKEVLMETFYAVARYHGYGYDYMVYRLCIPDSPELKAEVANYVAYREKCSVQHALKLLSAQKL